MLKIPFKLPRDQKLKSALVATTGTLVKTSKSPDEALGDLFAAVQQNRLYDDGKTFVDLVPRARMKSIQREYLLAKEDPNFDLREFVSRHFYEFAPHKKKEAFVTDTHRTISEHIHLLWDVLERRNRLNRGSLIALPHPYIVPGGRFSEQFYWDSYFIMLGLAADKRWKMIEGMMKNYTFMIRKFGFIPTANRTYFLSRSQPPFFSQMVKLLARHRGRTRTYAEYLPYMLSEYRFWMRGRTKLAKREHKAYARVVELPDHSYLNRYYDNKTTPRPESLNVDIETARESPGRESARLYLHLRAGAESGWDFSSRWFLDPHDIGTIHAADIIPVDLNCLLYQLEQTIAESYRLIKNPLLAKKFQHLADRRIAAIQKYCWSETEKFFVDYNFHHNRPTGQLSLAGVFPLYARIASKQQADAVADRLRKDFLKAGGLVSTLTNSGEQWDAPNGWAPLQWIAIEGLRNYGHHDLANEIKRRWVTLNMKVFTEKHKLIEKYSVESHQGLGGGGEYPLQDGFGWTNGVLAALLNER
ncbi:MAG TPA: alpha,alpha-trehalase TreF [Candidatus Saccharibacteria bacterium]|nr:alpha,alpha-trehalase TreF [Candidatus Saccharibacteria bacterium]HRK94568.1 alpha,alpha-trehalase TreF [Candidatus Saccharibacteria bacterium]